MPTDLTIRGIPSELYEMLREEAEGSGRSIGDVVIAHLEEKLVAVRVDPEEFLAAVDALSREIRLPRLTDADLEAAKRERRH